MIVTLAQQTAQYLETFKTLTLAEQEMVTQALKRVVSIQPSSSTDEALAKSIAGRVFSREERLQLEMETLVKHFQHRRQLLDPAFSATQVAELLGTSRQTPHDRVNSQTLLALRENGKLYFPTWQFDAAGPDRVIDGLPAVLKALAMSDYAKLNWLTRANPYLDGQTPVQALKAGQKDRVLAEAAVVEANQ
jgi:hypothetical protein